MFHWVPNTSPIIVSGYVSVFSITYSFFESIKFRSNRSQMSFKIDVFKSFAIFTGKHLCSSLFVIKRKRLLKRGSNTSVFLLTLQNFLEQFFLSNTFGSCFLKLCLKPIRTSPWTTKKAFTKLFWLLYW